MFQTEVVEKIKTHMLYSVTFLSPYNHAIDTVMRKNIVEPDTRQMTIWRINILRLVPKATDTHSEYGILLAFAQHQCSHEHT